MKKRVLVTDLVHDYLIQSFKNAGFEVDYFPEISLSQSKAIINRYVGVIINSKIKAHAEWIEEGTLLEFIGRLGSGMEIIDVEFAKSKGIKVYSAPEGNRNAVAEHALGMLLTLANKLLVGHQMVAKMEWNREAARGFEIEGKTIGIIGFGNTGRRFSEKLTGLGLQVLAHDKYLTNYTEDLSHVKESTISEIQSDCDIISLHLPLTKETHHYVDQRFVAACKKPFILINTARGQNVDTQALLGGLKLGKITGACLDVFENEKPPTFTEEEKKIFLQLYQMENVVLSPHVAGWTIESKFKIAACLVDKIIKDFGPI